MAKKNRAPGNNDRGCKQCASDQLPYARNFSTYKSYFNIMPEGNFVSFNWHCLSHLSWFTLFCYFLLISENAFFFFLPFLLQGTVRRCFFLSTTGKHTGFRWAQKLIIQTHLGEFSAIKLNGWKRIWKKLARIQTSNGFLLMLVSHFCFIFLIYLFILSFYFIFLFYLFGIFVLSFCMFFFDRDTDLFIHRSLFTLLMDVCWDKDEKSKNPLKIFSKNTKSMSFLTATVTGTIFFLLKSSKQLTLQSMLMNVFGRHTRT